MSRCGNCGYENERIGGPGDCDNCGMVDSRSQFEYEQDQENRARARRYEARLSGQEPDNMSDA